MPPRPSSVQSDGSLHPAMSQSPMAQDRGMLQSKRKVFIEISVSRVFAVASESEYWLPFLPSFRVYAEKPSDAPLWLPPVSLCTVAATVLRGTDASGDGPISAEQLHGWLWPAGRTIWPSRCVHSNYLCQGLTLFCFEILLWKDSLKRLKGFLRLKFRFIKVFHLIYDPLGKFSHVHFPLDKHMEYISLPHRNTMLSLVPPSDSVAAIYSCEAESQLT